MWASCYCMLLWAVWTACSPIGSARGLIRWIMFAKRFLRCTSRCKSNMLTKFTTYSHLSRSQWIRSTPRAKAEETPVIINTPRNLSRVIGFDVSSVVYGSWISSHPFAISFSFPFVLRFEISLDTLGTNSSPFWNIWNMV